jgi:hypothetical protein
MPNFPFQCKACQTLSYVASPIEVPGVCLKCGSVEFTRLANICYLVTTPTTDVIVPELGSFPPEKFPVVYRTKPNSELTPEAPNRNVSTACGAKKFPVHATDQVAAATCETCLKMAPGFAPEPEEESILTQAKPIPAPVDLGNVELTETFEDEDPNPFINKGE